MTPDPIFWQRSRHTPGGGDAVVYFEVYGDFPNQIETDLEVAGLSVMSGLNDFANLTPEMAHELRESNPTAAAFVESAPTAITIAGMVRDPDNLHYLRDCLQFVDQLLENGGVGVVELQSLQLSGKDEWREKFWSGHFEPTFHCVILLSMDERGIWLHTRGMRLYGRPDLSCHCVKPEEVTILEPIFNGLMRLQAAGGHVPEGQVVQNPNFDERLICRHRGHVEDDNFDNVHVELEWETPRGETQEAQESSA